MTTRLLATALLLSLAARAWPASERGLDLAEMVAAADEIVVGDVESSTAHWQGKLIVTVATVRVDESLKGVPGARIEITEPGGTAVHPVIGAPVRMDVSGQARLETGERVVLFVEQRVPGRRVVVGAAQGKFLVRAADDATATPGVPVGPKRLTVTRQAGTVVLGSESMSLDELRDRIRTLLGEKKP